MAKALTDQMVQGLGDLMNEVGRTSEDKGWRDEGRTPETLLLLLVSEIGEATEDLRREEPVDEGDDGSLDYWWIDADGKPQGFVVELADLLIRLLDTIDEYGVRVEFFLALNAKLEYNRTRPHRHEGKAF